MEKMNSRKRIFEILRLLYESHVSGLSSAELAASLSTSQANICRDMALFEKHGWTRRGIGSRRRLPPVFGGTAGRVMRPYQEAKLRLTGEEARYASEMQ